MGVYIHIMDHCYLLSLKIYFGCSFVLHFQYDNATSSLFCVISSLEIYSCNKVMAIILSSIFFSQSLSLCCSGQALSVLDGVPIAIKDEIDCLPYPTTGNLYFHIFARAAYCPLHCICFSVPVGDQLND